MRKFNDVKEEKMVPGNCVFMVALVHGNGKWEDFIS